MRLVVAAALVVASARGLATPGRCRLRPRRAARCAAVPAGEAVVVAAAGEASASEFEEEEAAAPVAAKWSKRAKWSKLASLVASDGPIVASAGVFLVLAALSDVAVPHFSSTALNAIVARDFDRARQGLVGLGLASVLGALFTGLRGGLFWLAGVRVVSRLRVRARGGRRVMHRPFNVGVPESTRREPKRRHPPEGRSLVRKRRVVFSSGERPLPTRLSPGRPRSACSRRCCGRSSGGSTA